MERLESEMDVRGTVAGRDIRDLRRSIYALGALFPKSPLRRAFFIFVLGACVIIEVLHLMFYRKRSIPIGIAGLLLALQTVLSISSTVFWHFSPASTGTIDVLSNFFSLTATATAAAATTAHATAATTTTAPATATNKRSCLRKTWWCIGVFWFGKALAESMQPNVQVTTDNTKDFTMAILSASSSTYLTGAAIITWSSYSLVCDALLEKLETFRLIHDTDANAVVDLSNRVTMLLSLKEGVEHVSKTFQFYLLSSFLLVTMQVQVALYSLTAFHRLDNKTNAISFLDIFVTYGIWMWCCLLAAIQVSGKSKGIHSTIADWHLKETFKSPPNDPSFVRTSIERQALVMNAAGLSGLTIFGYSIDSALTIAIFQFQLGLIQFTLGKTVSFPMDHKG